MKLRTSTPQQISEYIEMNKEFDEEFKKNGVGIRIAIENFQQTKLKRPNPPTPEMVERAKFIDKTYIWKHAGIRPGDKRSPE